MTKSPKMSAAPGHLRQDVRPPIETGTAPRPGAAAAPRRTAMMRRTVHPRVWPDTADGYPPDHPYVRRYWTALLGPGAVAELLRLATAAARGRSLPRPIHLNTLARYRLVTSHGDHLVVRAAIPRLTAAQVRRLHPRLRVEHAKADATSELSTPSRRP